jgi:membrane associated rhomboid family serine protease
MIMLVPISPEVPPLHRPRLWPGLIFLVFMGISYLEAYPTIQADAAYIENLQAMVETDAAGNPHLKPEAHSYLRLRPLLKISPCKGDWDLERLIMANFIHGSLLHLFLNLVGLFAGARICTSFVPFMVTVSVFLIGGSLGLLISMLFSSEASAYIPHLGASAGIFALMGTYYIYNFRYRTRYFFWFPTRAGIINLRTSRWFFVDVILLEIILSAAQFFPTGTDGVDHIAHVVGFATGACLALTLRTLQQWPLFLQTRGEFLYWAKIVRPRNFDPVQSPFNSWCELLQINPYNDELKAQLFRSVYLNSKHFTDAQIEYAFQFMRPTFIRLHTDEVGMCLKELLIKGRRLPPKWLGGLKYYSVIQIAKAMAFPPEEQHLLLSFVSEYRRLHSEGGEVDAKLELLMRKLSGLMPRAEIRSDDMPDNAISTHNQATTEISLSGGTAKGASGRNRR